MVNEAMAYAQLGEAGKADELLQKALKISPHNAAANFNMGLLKAERNELKGAEKHLKAALKADPQMAQAAYNLCVVTSKDRIQEAVTYCKKAANLRPQEPKYAYTLAFYQLQKGDEKDAVGTLKTLLERQPAYVDAYDLLGGTYEKQGRKEEAEKVYQKALEIEGIPDRDKFRFRAQLEALRQGKAGPGKK
jgi:Tfp pilus assembly protein PilF